MAYPVRPTPVLPTSFSFMTKSSSTKLCITTSQWRNKPGVFQETTLLPIDATWKFDPIGRRSGNHVASARL